jgi:microcystin-dependent protein
MPWNGAAGSKTFGRTDGTRTGSTTWAQADAASVDIISTDHDTHDQDVADGINAALCKDGGNTATANIPMGGFTFTNIAAATARTMPARMSDVQDGKAIYYPTVGGTADVITITGASTAITAYAAGQTFQFIAAATNTSTATINVDSVGAKSITGAAAATLQAGQIASGAIVTITYDGTQFQLTNTSPVAVSVGTIMAWPTSTVPNGWLECYGQAISRTTYSALFAAISTVYGVGDGSSTFNLPDMRGRSVFGEDDMGGSSANRLTGLTDGVNGDTLGAVGGLESTTIAQANLPVANLSHSLSVSTTLTNGTNIFRGSFATQSIDQNDPESSAIGSSGVSAETVSLASGTVSGTVALGGSGTAVNNLPPTIILKWIILAVPASTLSVYTPTNGSELTLASGGIINFNSGDVLITHSANALAWTGASSGYSFDALMTITSTNASAFAVGRQGATAPVLKINAATASVATGIEITGAAAAGRVAVAAISSGTNEGLDIDAKGSGTIRIANTSTGAVTIVPATTVTGAITPTGGIAAAGGFTATPRNVHTGDNPATAAADGTNLDIVVTELYVAECFIPANCTVTGVAPFFGANTNGNVKVMLFDSAGTRVAISASTAAGAFTADDYTRVAFTGTYAAVGPATYYVGIICDDNTNDLNTHVVGNFGAGKITGLVYATEAGYATISAPATFTTGLGPIATLY